MQLVTVYNLIRDVKQSDAGAASDQLFGGREQTQNRETQVLLQGLLPLQTLLQLDLHPHQRTHQLTQFGNKEEIKQENLEDLKMEDRAELVYENWAVVWNAEKNKEGAKTPLKDSIRKTFYSNHALMQNASCGDSFSTSSRTAARSRPLS